jgi:hypothetical protein
VRLSVSKQSANRTEYPWPAIGVGSSATLHGGGGGGGRGGAPFRREIVARIGISRSKKMEISTSAARTIARLRLVQPTLQDIGVTVGRPHRSAARSTTTAGTNR